MALIIVLMFHFLILGNLSSTSGALALLQVNFASWLTDFSSLVASSITSLWCSHTLSFLDCLDIRAEFLSLTGISVLASLFVFLS